MGVYARAHWLTEPFFELVFATNQDFRSEQLATAANAGDVPEDLHHAEA